MTATKRSPNCYDCDCCLIYKSNFCEQLVTAGSSLTYLGDEWNDDASTGGESWQISTTDGGCVGLDCPDTDKPFASGLYHVSLDDRLAILEQRIPTAYHASLDFELFYDSSLPTSDYNIGLEVFWDFAGTNKYGSVRVSFDYETSTGLGYGYSLKIEVISAPTGVETVIGEFSVALPSGVENYRGILKLGLLEAPTGCDDPVLCVTLTGDSASASRQFPVSLIYPDVNTTQFAMAIAYSAYADATTFDCDGVVTSIPQHVRVYEVFIERDESQRAECETCTWGCCKCGIPLEFDVTFSGFSDSECEACDELNGTYSLQYEAPCEWLYTFDYYSMPNCFLVSYDGTEIIVDLYIKAIEIRLIDNVYYLSVVTQIFCGFGTGSALRPFAWTFTEGTATLPKCKLTSADSWSYLSNSSSRTQPAPARSDCSPPEGFPVEIFYFNIGDFCSSVGTVTVQNG